MPKNLEEVLEKAEALLLRRITKNLYEISAEKFRKYNIRVVIDGKNCLDKEKIIREGIIYKGIGR